MKFVLEEDLRIVEDIRKQLASCILGKEEEILLLLTAFLAGGHVLLEDVPGTGKTVLIKALARTVDGQFRRIQCNPDLLPTDITGVSIYQPKNESFVFRPGPIMTNILLADEINRATTKTQSALLEAMEERSVTVDGVSYSLPRPFLLLATQNPVEFEGTYLLPEAQLDRFMMKFSLGYPDFDNEIKMIQLQAQKHPLESLRPVTNSKRMEEIQRRIRNLHIDESVLGYIVEISRKTREYPGVMLGASPRATLALVDAAKAYAFLNGRDFVLPDDVKYLVPYVFRHRLLLNTDARMDGKTPDSVLSDVLEQVKVPVRLEN